jgi:hypothetical protein
MVDWRIYERDVDIILAEEFYANADFADWVLSQTGLFDGKGNGTVTEVRVSLSDEKGESDLVVIFEKTDKSRIALLIEDKIDAVFQPDQLDRYRARGANGFAEGRWKKFEVVLLAPRTYIDKSPISKQFDATLAYEDIAAWIRSNIPGRRGEYRADFLHSAAPRGASAYVKKTDEATDAFWKAALELAHGEFPELEMKNQTFASGNTWVEFRPNDLPVRVRVFLKGEHGNADLTFIGIDLVALERAVSNLPKFGTTHQTGKSAAIRMTFPHFLVTEGVSAVDVKVRPAFERCRDLIHFYREHRGLLEPLVTR